ASVQYPSASSGVGTRLSRREKELGYLFPRPASQAIGDHHIYPAHLWKRSRREKRTCPQRGCGHGAGLQSRMCWLGRGASLRQVPMRPREVGVGRHEVSLGDEVVHHIPEVGEAAPPACDRVSPLVSGDVLLLSRLKVRETLRPDELLHDRQIALVPALLEILA